MKKKETSNIRVFETKDFNLASYLKTVGYKQTALVQDGNKVIFGFIDDEKRPGHILDWFNNKGNFKMFSAMQRDLKTMLNLAKKQ